jgi:hypothetical protein
LRWGCTVAAELVDEHQMLDRVLAISIKLIVTALIAGAAMAAVLLGYTGFTQLVRAHLATAGWMIGVGVVSGWIAYVVAARREDLVDC